MLLLRTTAWITIYLAVIQLLITGVVADHSRNNNITQSISGNENSDSTSDSSPKHVLDKLTYERLLSIRNSSDETCNSPISYNISNMHDSEIKALIQSQARNITERNMNITRDFHKIENITSNFAIYPNFVHGNQAITLAILNIQRSKNLLELIMDHNSLIRAYKCIKSDKNNFTYEISEEKFNDTLRYNENVFNQFYFLYHLASAYIDFFNQHQKYIKSLNKYNSSKTVDDLNMVLIELNIMVNVSENFVQQQKEFHKFMGNNKLHEKFQTQFILYISNITYFKEDLQKKKNNLEHYEREKDAINFENLLNKRIQPVVHGIIFVVGFIGNLILLVIFARHKEIRNPPSMMILNLTLADAFNLPINIPVFLIYLTSHSWDYGEGLCIAYRFLRQLGIAVSIYSIVIISIQRFLALTQMFKNNGWGSKLTTRSKSILLIVSVWIIGSLIATPHTIHAGIYNGQCYGGSKDNSSYGKFITLFDFILFCAVPLVLIATLSIATSLIIKRSVRNIPGETMGMDKYIKTRIISANVLIALTVVSAASYFPYYLFMFLFAWEDIQIETQEFQIIFFIVYTLMFANCCFNPIALYIFSHKFRKYIHKYLFCRSIDDGNGGPKFSSGTTTSSSFMAKI